MIEKYEVISDQWGYSVAEDGVGDIAFFKSSPAGCMAKENAETLCTKLNRLAALEAVCGEIVTNAPQSEKELEQMYEIYINGGLQKEAGYVSYGEEVQKFIIAQKLKAVLEEA